MKVFNHFVFTLTYMSGSSPWHYANDSKIQELLEIFFKNPNPEYPNSAALGQSLKFYTHTFRLLVLLFLINKCASEVQVKATDLQIRE